MDIASRFRANLATLLHAHGDTASSMARRVGVSPRQARRVVRGDTGVTLDLVQAIADAYDVCPGRLAFSAIAVFAAYLRRVGVTP